MKLTLLEKLKYKIEEARANSLLIWKPLILVKDICRHLTNKFFVGEYFAYLTMDGKGLYIVNPKVASTTLIHALSLSKVLSIKEKDLCKYDNLFKFSFVRNPYHRIVSCYNNKINGSMKGFVNGMWVDFWRYNGKFYPNMTFKDFVKSICLISDDKADKHFKSQHCFLMNKKRDLIPNFIGKFENLEKDYKVICNILGFKENVTLPHFNKSSGLKDYMSCYDEETKKLMMERYKRDFELFGYT